MRVPCKLYDRSLRLWPPVFFSGAIDDDIVVVEAFSARSRHRVSLEKARHRVLQLVKSLGSISALGREVFGNVDLPDFDPSVGTLLDIVCGKKDPRVLQSYCKECDTYFQWVVALVRDPTSVGSVLLCRYFHMAASRGKSVPTVIRCALEWCETHTRAPSNVWRRGD